MKMTSSWQAEGSADRELYKVWCLLGEEYKARPGDFYASH